jgi:hypothetical protein
MPKIALEDSPRIRSISRIWRQRNEKKGPLRPGELKEAALRQTALRQTALRQELRNRIAEDQAA